MIFFKLFYTCSVLSYLHYTESKAFNFPRTHPTIPNSYLSIKVLRKYVHTHMNGWPEWELNFKNTVQIVLNKFPSLEAAIINAQPIIQLYPAIKTYFHMSYHCVLSTIAWFSSTQFGMVQYCLRSLTHYVMQFP